MIQHIRPSQDVYIHQQGRPASVAKPFHDGDGKLEADLRTPAPPTAATKEQVEQAASRVKDVLRGSTSRLEIEIDPDLHRAVIKILNGESGEIIRQIPAQELLDLAKSIDESKGFLVSERA
ncbi:MAG: flagellar protein FlaG [Nitrospira sp. CG24E]|nr:MAG: flagellar protein FlaG [Nitrospira sp. CG24E]